MKLWFFMKLARLLPRRKFWHRDDRLVHQWYWWDSRRRVHMVTKGHRVLARWEEA